MASVTIRITDGENGDVRVDVDFDPAGVNLASSAHVLGASILLDLRGDALRHDGPDLENMEVQGHG